MIPYYSIYEMIGKFVKFKLSSRHGGKTVRSVIECVYRDIIKHNIEITIENNYTYVFSEPDSIIHNKNDVVFIYGSKDEVSDDAFFEECNRLSNHGYGINEVFKTFDSEYYAVSFEISKPPIKKKNKKR